MAMTGTWTIFFDWSSSGNYRTASLAFAADGTFTSTPGGAGKWVQNGGIVALRYDNPPNTSFFGVLAGKVVTGAMTAFGGKTGDFYMLEQPVQT